MLQGPCAKQTVTATIVSPTGERFSSTNYTLNPQTTCPRDAHGFSTGEGYHLCKEVCHQPGHAEINALQLAGASALGATLFLEGHSYVCDPCKTAAEAAGISLIVVGIPPLP